MSYRHLFQRPSGTSARASSRSLKAPKVQRQLRAAEIPLVLRYGSPDPKKVQHRASTDPFFERKGLKFAQEAILGCLGYAGGRESAAWLARLRRHWGELMRQSEAKLLIRSEWSRWLKQHPKITAPNGNHAFIF